MWSVVGAVLGWEMALGPWAWPAVQGSSPGLCVLGLLLKVLDPLPKARSAACFCFCGMSPRAQHGSGSRGAGGHQRVPGEPRPTPTQAPVHSAWEVGLQTYPSCLARIPFCPLSHLCCEFKPGVPAPLGQCQVPPT